MNYKTVSKPMVKVLNVPKTNDYKAKFLNLFNKISSLLKNRHYNRNKYKYINNDRSIEILSVMNFYSNRYHSNL